LAFKPDIDDLRESPAIKILEGLINLKCELIAVEPNINKLPDYISNNNIKLLKLDEALLDSDVVCVLVNHKDFVNEYQKITNCNNIIDVVGLC
jgi:UDP-N-acetyl-D-mannosaminuronic acid dehydrogenase